MKRDARRYGVALCLLAWLTTGCRGPEGEGGRHHAVLMPLRAAMMSLEDQRDYGSKVLEQIDELDITEAAPLLEKGLTWGSAYWDLKEKHHAAELWIRFKTAGMEEGERLDLLVSTFRPGFPIEVQGNAGEELEKLGGRGRDKLVEMLRTEERSFSEHGDVLIAANLASFLSLSEALGIALDRAVELSSSSSPFVRFVCLRYFSHRGSPRATEIAMALLKHPDSKKPQVRSGMLYGLSHCPGSEKVFARLLGDLAKEPESLERDGTVGAALNYIAAAQATVFKDAPAELKEQVEIVAKRAIRAPKICWGDPLALFGRQYSNREKAKEILARWMAE